ncbi:MAG: cation:proton antiporter [bacterium]|nr:cation:proton antiporter [bacterium]MDD5354301.1 cation:proton antiporter [bacterium]MDD5756917.1 cation:proton antiporter [bacterium]
MLSSMYELLTSISLYKMDILFFLGAFLLAGSISGRFFQKQRIPQVVGYITIGILIGQSGLRLVDSRMIETLQPFSYFALGLIGFVIGGELKIEVFKKYGRQFIYILLFEGITASILVFLLVGITGTLLIGPGKLPWALGLLLGAIASATAPAATTDVLREYKTKGPLTTTIMGIVALDDGLALLLFAIASSIASRMLGSSNGNLLATLTQPLHEITLSIIIGAAAGWGLYYILKRTIEKEKILAFTIATVLLVLGISLTLRADMLLAAMTLGAVIANTTSRRSKEVFHLIGGFSNPLYVLFFVMVGAKLDITHMTLTLSALAIAYLIGRTAGKMFGAAWGARLAKAPIAVQKYLPLCLFDQAGVAIGLSILAAQYFPGEIGNGIVIIVTVITFVVQIIGPPYIKKAITKAGEIGLNISEEDMIRRIQLKEVMENQYFFIKKDMQLAEVLKIFTKGNNLYYPVTDKENKLVGVISIHNIQQFFLDSDVHNLLLACDLMEPIKDKVSEQATLYEAKEIMDNNDLEYLPVLCADGSLAGMIERSHLQKAISTKYLEIEKRIANLEQG